MLEETYIPVKHSDVAIGDVVYFDNYEDGKYPQANPKISGPFTKVVGNGCGRCFTNSRGSLMHYPENLLKKVSKQVFYQWKEEVQGCEHYVSVHSSGEYDDNFGRLLFDSVEAAEEGLRDYELEEEARDWFLVKVTYEKVTR